MLCTTLSQFVHHFNTGHKLTAEMTSRKFYYSKTFTANTRLELLHHNT